MASKFCILVGILCIIICSDVVDAEMECRLFNFGDNPTIEKWTDKYVNRCPSLLGNSDKEYCCYDLKREPHCCDATEFIFNVSIMVVIAIVILMLISSVVSCICCLCCPCCCLYKRRHSGRVLRNEPINVIHTNNSRTNTVYQPIVKSQHIPPGAYPVLPQTTDIKHYSRFQR